LSTPFKKKRKNKSNSYIGGKTTMKTPDYKDKEILQKHGDFSSFEGACQ